ncbi:hypothetical protein [Enterococcus faecalis]
MYAIIFMNAFHFKVRHEGRRLQPKLLMLF